MPSNKSRKQVLCDICWNIQYAKLRSFYKKVVSDLESARADHNIIVYRFRDKSSKIHEDYQDDGKNGAGRKILKAMRDNNV